MQNRVAFLPFYRLCLRAAKPLPFVPEPKTLRDHLKRRRMLLGQLQREAAAIIGVNLWTYIGWEKKGVLPALAHFPRVVAYLGYDPLSHDKTLGASIVAARRRLGLSQKRLAEQLEVDPATLAKWETGASMPGRSIMVRLTRIL